MTPQDTIALGVWLTASAAIAAWCVVSDYRNSARGIDRWPHRGTRWLGAVRVRRCIQRSGGVWWSVEYWDQFWGWQLSAYHATRDDAISVADVVFERIYKQRQAEIVRRDTAEASRD